MLFLTKLYQIVQSYPPIAANTMLGICVTPVVALYCSIAVHMYTVLWSAVLHAVLHTAQPLQPLHSPAPDWLHTS